MNKPGKPPPSAEALLARAIELLQSDACQWGSCDGCKNYRHCSACSAYRDDWDDDINCPAIGKHEEGCPIAQFLADAEAHESEETDCECTYLHSGKCDPETRSYGIEPAYPSAWQKLPGFIAPSEKSESWESKKHPLADKLDAMSDRMQDMRDRFHLRWSDDDCEPSAYDDEAAKKAAK